MTVKMMIEPLVLLAALVVLLSGCGGAIDDIVVPPFEDIESIAFARFPGATPVGGTDSLERPPRTSDAQVCVVTGASRSYMFDEPVLFSEVREFYNELALEAGWSIEDAENSTREEALLTRPPDSLAFKEVEGKTHSFRLYPLPDPAGYGDVGPIDQRPVSSFSLLYIIDPDPAQPHC